MQLLTTRREIQSGILRLGGTRSTTRGFAILLAQQLVDELVFTEPANEVLLINHTA